MAGVYIDGEFISNSMLNGKRRRVEDCNTIDELATYIKIESWGTSEEPTPDYICYHMGYSYPLHTHKILQSTTNVKSVYDINLILKVSNRLSDAHENMSLYMKRLLLGILVAYRNRKE